LEATAPNQEWTWYITKMPSIERSARLFLYRLFDLFRRYVVGWLIAGTQSSALARRLLGSCASAHPSTA
jgi:transposase InsO family protein